MVRPIEQPGDGGGGGGDGGGGLPGNFPRQLPPRGQTERIELLTAGLGSPVALAYGRHVVRGNRIFERQDAGKQVIFQALGEGEWDSPEALWINGVPVELTPTTPPLVSGPNWHFHPGMDGTIGPGGAGQETDATVRNQHRCFFWPSTIAPQFTFSRTAYLALKLDPDVGAPEPGFDIRGIYKTRRVRTFDNLGNQTIAYSANPAWVALDLLILRHIKPHSLVNEALTTAEKDKIDFQAFKDWADDCDVVTPQGTKRFEAHVAFINRTDLLRALEYVLLLGRAYLLERSGKFAPFMDKSRASVLTVGAGDIIAGSMALARKSVREAPNLYRAGFRALDSGDGPGTIATVGAAVTGTNTRFTALFVPNSPLILLDGAQAGQVRRVLSVASDISMTLVTAFAADQSGRKYANPSLDFQPQQKESADEAHQDEIGGRIQLAEVDLGNTLPERAERLIEHLRKRTLGLARQGALRLASGVPGALDLLPGDVFTGPDTLEFDPANTRDWEVLEISDEADGSRVLAFQEFDATVFSDAAGTQQGNVPAAGLLPAQLAATVINEAFTYTSTVSSITWSWTITLRFPNGVTLALSGSRATTGLAASTTYFFLPYFDALDGAVKFVAGGTGSTGEAHTTKTTERHAQQHLNHRLPLSVGFMSAATPAAGSGGGSGGGDACIHEKMVVLSRQRGIIPILAVVVGEEISCRRGWTTVARKVVQKASTFIKLDVGGEEAVVTPSHPLCRFKTGRQIRAALVGLGTLLRARNGPCHPRAIRLVSRPGQAVSLTCEPHREFWFGERTAFLAAHNLQPLK